MASEFFTKGSVSYAEYKAQCVSLRLFAFAGTTTFCVLALINSPPKSSYWVRYSPSYLPSFLGGVVAPSTPPLFLNSKAEGTDVPAIASQLVTLRRLEGASSDDEE